VGKSIRRIILETGEAIGEKYYKSNYVENLMSGEEKCIHISLTNNRSNVWENQKTFENFMTADTKH
jgi:hypothetical protein